MPVKIVRCEVCRGSLLDRGLRLGRKLRLKVVSDSLCNFALNGENIREVAIIRLSPKMRVGPRVDQLRIHPHAIGCALHAAL